MQKDQMPWEVQCILDKPCEDIIPRLECKIYEIKY